MQIDPEDLKKTKRLELMLLEELGQGDYKPHSYFLSESDIRTKYGFNQTTVRRAINNLAMRGLLYRINGRGTFVAPRQQRTILIVSLYSMRRFSSQHSIILNFFAGAVLACDENSQAGFNCTVLTSNEFRLQLDHCEQVYPRLAAVIFLSDADTCEFSSPILKQKNIPHIYYGSDASLVGHKFPLTYSYSQQKIVDSALSYLTHKGHKKIGILYSNTPPRMQRYELARKWLAEHGLTLDPNAIWKVDYIVASEQIDRFGIFTDYFSKVTIPADIDAVFCTDDAVALYFIQAMHRLGTPVDQRLSVIGVNNYPLCEHTIPNLTSVEIPFHMDAQIIIKQLIDVIDNGLKEFHLESKLRIVVRESA